MIFFGGLICNKSWKSGKNMSILSWKNGVNGLFLSWKNGNVGI